VTRLQSAGGRDRRRRGAIVRVLVHQRRAGATLRRAAAAADVHVATVCRWQRHDRALRRRLREAARDFRLVTIGPAYKKSRLEPTEENTYLARVPKPASGWTAFFVELAFDRGGPVPFKFTTQVSVVPDVLPHRIEELLKAPK
jgi:PhoPQ-activated pathogenicity-related protein